MYVVCMNANSACFSLLTQKSYLSRLMEIQRALMMSEFFKRHEVKTWLASYSSHHSCQSCYLNPVGPDQSQIVTLYISPMLFDYNRELYWLLMWSKTAFAFQSFSHFTNYLCLKKLPFQLTEVQLWRVWHVNSPLPGWNPLFEMLYPVPT